MLLIVAAGCCWWLMLLIAAVDSCCWLLLLVVAAGCCWWLMLLTAAVDSCCWLLLLVVADCWCWWLLLVAAVGSCCWLMLLIAQKVFEYFRVADDLRPRQICRRKSLWIFSGCWWFAAKTNLQAKKSLNTFGLLMGCGQDKFAGEKVFEYFPEYGWEEGGREFRLGEVGSWR